MEGTMYYLVIVWLRLRWDEGCRTLRGSRVPACAALWSAQAGRGW